MSRPNSTILHHAIATGDFEKVQTLLKQGVVDADARLQIDDDILETASRKSLTSIRSYRKHSVATEFIMEEENESGDVVRNVTSGGDPTENNKSSELINEKSSADGVLNAEAVVCPVVENEDDNDIDHIMEECQNEAEEENESEQRNQGEITVIEAPTEPDYLQAEVDLGAKIKELESQIESERAAVEMRARPAHMERLKDEYDDSEDEGIESSPNLNNNRRSLADTIDLKLRDDNEGLFERAPSMRIKDMTHEAEGGDDETRPKKLIPRIKRKISLKFTKRPKKDLLEDEDEEGDDLTYINLVKTRNVDDEQLEENFEGVAFFEAVRDGMDMIVQTLLETSDNYQLNMLDENGFTPAMQAAWHGQVECLQILLSHGANLDLRNATGCTAAHFAAGQGHTECLQSIIKEDPEQVDSKTKFGATPLILAAKGGHRECTEVLLDSGADPNIRYRGNQNSLLFAAGNGHYECIEALIEHQVDLDQPNSQRVTPLMRAVQQGHNTCVALLTEKGANIDLQDAIGRTAIHFAVEHNNLKGLKLLLQSGASVEFKTKGGSKPLDYAERFRNTRCAEMLENHINKLKEELDLKDLEGESPKQQNKVHEKEEKTVTCLSFKHLFRRRSTKKKNV